MGDGAFGSVDLIQHDSYGECVMKAMKYDTVRRRDIMLREVSILEHLRSVDCHWNIRMHGHEELDGEIRIFMEFVSGHELAQIELDIEKDEDFRKWLLVAKELVDAVICIHRENVVHRDIKLENIMFGHGVDGAVLKLIDFGTAVKTTDIGMLVAGTVTYMSPEVVRFVKSGRQMSAEEVIAADIWAVGVTLFRLAYNRPLIPLRPASSFQDAKEALYKDILKFNYRRYARAETDRDGEIYSLLYRLFHARAVNRTEYFATMSEEISKIQENY